MFSKKISPALYALVSACLFGASMPASKIVLAHIPAALLASLLYLGSGLGLSVCYAWQKFIVIKQNREPDLCSDGIGWLLASIVLGGVAAPILLMIGLSQLYSANVSLLLNLESVFTALFAWLLFKEHYSQRIAFGMLLIVLGGAVLAFAPRIQSLFSFGAIPIVLACACWALDNNLTRKISSANPLFIAMIKGLVAGVINYILAIKLFNAACPPIVYTLLALIIGFLGYGLSLWLFIKALRELGAARTGAYFSCAPFIGAALSVIILQEPFSIRLLLAGSLMAFGVWLHLTETHNHEHVHEFLEHEHMHTHDEHHQHEHDFPVDMNKPHSHKHKHERLVHSHPHFPDIHHQHNH